MVLSVVVTLSLVDGQVAECKLAQRFGIMCRQHQAEVIDAGRRWWCRWLGLRYLAMHVATQDERNRLTSRMALPVHVQAGEILWIEAQFDAPTNQRLVDGIPIAGEGDRGGAGDAAHDRPAEGFAEQRWLDGVEWTVAGEALDGCLAGLSVHACVAYLLSPGREAIVELLEAGDTLSLGLEQEPLSNVAAEPLLFSASLRSIRPTVDQADAEHRAAAFERGMPVWTPVINMQLVWQAAALDGGAQHLLASAGVLVRHPAAMNEESAEVIHEQEQIGALAAGHAWKRHEWADEHVAHPALVGTFSFETAEGAWLTRQGGAVQPAAVQMLADGPLRQMDAMPGFQNRADLDCGASWQFQS